MQQIKITSETLWKYGAAESLEISWHLSPRILTKSFDMDRSGILFLWSFLESSRKPPSSSRNLSFPVPNFPRAFLSPAHHLLPRAQLAKVSDTELAKCEVYEVTRHLTRARWGYTSTCLRRSQVLMHRGKLIINIEYCITFRKRKGLFIHPATVTPLCDRERVTNATGSNLRVCPSTASFPVKQTSSSRSSFCRWSRSAEEGSCFSSQSRS